MSTNEEARVRYTRRIIEKLRDKDRTQARDEKFGEYVSSMLKKCKDRYYTDQYSYNDKRYDKQNFIKLLNGIFKFDETPFICKDIAQVLNVSFEDATMLLEDLEKQEELEAEQKREREKQEILHKQQLAEEEKLYILSLALEKFNEPVAADKLIKLYDIDEDVATFISVEIKKAYDIKEEKFRILDRYVDKLQEKCMLKEVAELLDISFKEAKEYVENRILQQEQDSEEETA